MFVAAHSVDPPALVILQVGAHTSDDEYDGIVQEWERLFRDARGSMAAGVVVVPRGHSQPSPRSRRRLAETLDKPGAPLWVGIVTENPLIRGVITAINWLMRPRPGYYSYAFATIEDAAANLAKFDPRQASAIRLLYAEAINRLRKAS